MAFEGLSDRLEAAFKRLRSKGNLTESDVKEAMREVRLALLEADVNYKVAKDFTNKVTERAIGSHVLESLTPAQMVIKIVNEELTELMGGTGSKLAYASHGPTIIMMCGLQGSGKTTHCAKIALKLKNEGHRPLLVACDVYRPAAIKQLQVVGEQAGVTVFEEGQGDPVKIAKDAVSLAKDKGYDYVFIDTAGRLHIDETLMNELKNIKAEVHPHEILLVVDAMTGQDAVTVASAFDDALGIDGMVLTKLDGDTRGGAALSARAVTGKPIKFVGMGEKLTELDYFHPDRMASRILGMGDMLSLIEKAEMALDEKKAAELEKKLRKNKFDLNDLLSQLQQIRKMGSMKDLLGMLPGVGSKIKDMDVDESQFDRVQAIIFSMTYKERSNPDIINPSRKRRIAAGCGMQVEDVNKLLKQYRDMQKLFKQFNSKSARRRFSKMGNFGMRRQPEHPIQSHIIYNHAVLLSFGYSQSSSHHLQVLGKRQRRSSQLYKLHIRTVKSLRENVHIHQHLDVTFLEGFNVLLSFRGRSLRVYGNGIHAMFLIQFCDFLSMTDIDSIHDALSVLTKFFQAPIEPFDARLLIQQHIHFLVLVVTICTSLLQGVNEPLRHTIRFDAYEIVCRQSSLADKLRNTPRLHQYVKQVSESLTVQSARCSRQSQKLSLRESLPHLLVSFGKRMVCLVNHNQSRLFLYLVIVFHQPLDGHRLDG